MSCKFSLISQLVACLQKGRFLPCGFGSCRGSVDVRYSHGPADGLLRRQHVNAWLCRQVEDSKTAHHFAPVHPFLLDLGQMDACRVLMKRRQSTAVSQTIPQRRQLCRIQFICQPMYPVSTIKRFRVREWPRPKGLTADCRCVAEDVPRPAKPVPCLKSSFESNGPPEPS